MTEKTNVSQNPAVEVARDQQGSDAGSIIMMSTGVRVRVRPVSAILLDEVRSRVKDPEVPILMDEEKGREIPNPHDPTFLRQMEEAEDRRNRSVVDAMIMFGVELVDPLPESDRWLKELKFLGIEVDQDDELAVEFAYKKYVVVGAPDQITLMNASAPVSQKEVDRAMTSFQRDEERDADSGVGDAKGGS